MIKKRKIVIASLLKPVDEIRMYEKFALSMSQTSKYDINIIGFASKNIPSHENIRFHPIFYFKRISIRRLLAPLYYWKRLVKVKPELIVVNSHDLLIVSCAYKILFGCKLCYDVQENYKANIIWSSGLPRGLRHLLAYGVRLKEHITKRMIVHFFVAERCYLNECSFINSAYTVLENKALRPSGALKNKTKALFLSKTEDSPPLQLIYSGTIAESYGIFDCLQLMDELTSKGYKAELTIIGYCPRADTLEKLRLIVRNNPHIWLIGGDIPVPHSAIIEELRKADFALVSYRLNPSNQACMPTRIWECLAYKVPMIMKKEHPWLSLLYQYQAGISLDYCHPQGSDLQGLFSNSFYTTPIPDTFYWDYEKKKLLQALESLF